MYNDILLQPQRAHVENDGPNMHRMCSRLGAKLFKGDLRQDSVTFLPNHLRGECHDSTLFLSLVKFPAKAQFRYPLLVVPSNQQKSRFLFVPCRNTNFFFLNSPISFENKRARIKD